MLKQESKKKFGELLLDSGIITEEQLEYALRLQKNTSKKLGELLVEEKIVSEKEVVDVLEFQLRIPQVNFGSININPEIPRLISESLARKHLLIPVEKQGNQLVVAMADPMDLFAIDDVKFSTNMDIKPVIASKSDIINAIDKYYGKESAEKAVEDFTKEYNFNEFNDIEDGLLDKVSNAPVVRLVNSIILHAVKLRASDIHIEPLEKSLRIRFRIDGELQDIMESSKTAHSAIVTRVKIMGGMDIAEKRLPQDGRVETSVDGKAIDLRLSILPTVYGEKVVIRLLGRSDMLLPRSQLGFTPENMSLFEKILKNPNGIILVSGPTGSGKTTTLYAVLKELNKPSRNLITIEDPVEYKLEGVNQVQVNNKAGLTFGKGLRSILRQDPDIIMIGEIRDVETAQISVRAAITGHLVLSTIHTNDSVSTISRLLDMGIEPYLVSSSVVGVVAQRLVRRVCQNCKVAYEPNKSEMKILNLKEKCQLYRGNGCINCNNTGYFGRTAIHEIMVINREMRELIDNRAGIDMMRSTARQYGTTSLKKNCINLVLNGTTTVDELVKATYTIE